MKEIVIPIYIKVKVGKTHMEDKQLVASISAKMRPGLLPMAYLLISFHFLTNAIKALFYIG